MINEPITPLEKNKIVTVAKKTIVTSSGCCGGAPVKVETACCKLDEAKKSESENGCGCNTPEVIKVHASCC